MNKLVENIEVPEFEERADQLPSKEIDTVLVDGEIFKNARRKLLATGAKLLVGPRGTGKTHLMRYTYLHAQNNSSAPLVLYSSFSHYLRLEPLLKRSPDALKRFHSWVLAKLLLSCFDWLESTDNPPDCLTNLNNFLNKEKLNQLVTLLERDSGDDIYEEYGQHLTVELVISAARAISMAYSRKRVVFLLDDAALTLSEQHLIAFFEIFRLLKTEHTSPKASVYPGTTQYGPTFHASHEVESISLWLDTNDPNYSTIMGEIALKRFTEKTFEKIKPETFELLKYISFGIPRFFLRLLREHSNLDEKQSQSKINKIINDQTVLIKAEYDSLALKAPQFSSLIKTGWELFEKSITDISQTQSNNLSIKNINLGILQDTKRNPLIDRMLRFLIEVGLLFPLQPVSHGSNRKYDRYIPHLAFLYQSGAFREGRRSSFDSLAQVMRKPEAKHPVRRDIKTLLSSEKINNLHLDLPPCQNCDSQRINDSQRFCHNCGSELIQASLFEECMKINLEDIPDISPALIRRIHEQTALKTIGDIYSSQNVAADLQQATYVGPIRAKQIIEKVTVLVNEFLS